jgi:hypothetical protein
MRSSLTGRRSIQIMALAVIVVSATQAIAGVGLPDGRIGSRVAPILLLTREDVRRDLKLTPQQISEAEGAISDLRDKAQALSGRADAEAAKAQIQVNRTSQQWLKDHLNAEQQARLIQLDLQWEGPSALLTRPLLAESLQLTDAQRVSVAKAIASRNTKRKGGAAVPTDEIELFKVVKGALTPDQVASWRAMLGPIAPFQVAIHPLPDDLLRK